MVPKNDDKILVLDLCRLACPSHLFDDVLLTGTGDESLSTYRSFNQAAVTVSHKVREISKKVFLQTDFLEWRKTYFASYLQDRRREEKEAGRYQKPYIDYLSEMEDTLFRRFFEENRWEFLKSYLLDNAPLDLEDPRLPYFQALIEKGSVEKDAPAIQLKDHLLAMPKELIIHYLKTMRSYQELSRPLWGKYYFSTGGGLEATEKDLAHHFYPGSSFGYTKSYAFQENVPFGSIFKLFTAYEGLRQHYNREVASGRQTTLNPLTLVDQSPPTKRF